LKKLLEKNRLLLSRKYSFSGDEKGEASNAEYGAIIARIPTRARHGTRFGKRRDEGMIGIPAFVCIAKQAN
jgi:hypothetical protein